MEVLAVKINRSLNDYTKGKNTEDLRESVLDCTQKYWRVSEKKAKEVKFIIGLKDGVIHSAFEVTNYSLRKSDNRKIFFCGNSIEEFIGKSIINGSWTIRYFSLEDIKSFKSNKLTKEMIFNYYKSINIPYK